MTEEQQQTETEPTGDAEAQAELETQAKAQGWAPKDQWKGDPEQWRTAQEFLDYGKTEREVLTQKNEFLAGEVATLKARQTELLDLMKDFKQYHEKTAAREYERALKNIQAEQRQAVEEGDVQRFDALQREAEAVVQESKDAQTKTVNGQPRGAPHPDFEVWKAANPWYLDDVDMTEYADKAAPMVRQKHPTVEGRAFYDLVTEKVKDRFPDRFDNPNRRRAPAVGNSSQPQERGKSGRTFQDLPPEAKTVCRKYVKEGLLTEAQYLEDYFGDAA